MLYPTPQWQYMFSAGSDDIAKLKVCINRKQWPPIYTVGPAKVIKALIVPTDSL